MPIDSQLRAIEVQTTAGPAPAALAANKLIRNTCLLLATTPAFSAPTAAASRTTYQAMRI